MGMRWLDADLDSIYFHGNSSNNTINEFYLNDLEKEFKPLLNKYEGFNYYEFHLGLERSMQNLLPSGPRSLSGCFSNDTGFLGCEYSQDQQLVAYRIKLHPKLIKLACSDAAIAEGIARRSYSEEEDGQFGWYDSSSPNFGLAVAILKEMNSKKPCIGLAKLPESIRYLLRQKAEQ